MLVLTRKKDQQLIINLGAETVQVRILDVGRDRVRIGITAPRSVTVHREEVALRIQEEQRYSSALLAASAHADAAHAGAAHAGAARV